MSHPVASIPLHPSPSHLTHPTLLSDNLLPCHPSNLSSSTSYLPPPPELISPTSPFPHALPPSSSSSLSSPPPPIAVYPFHTDDDDDDSPSPSSSSPPPSPPPELELITEEQVYAAADEAYPDPQSSTSLTHRRLSLLSSSPLPLPRALSLSSPSTSRSLTFTLPPPSFHLLLIDEEPTHAAALTRQLHRQHRHLIITTCLDGDEAVALLLSLASRPPLPRLPTTPLAPPSRSISSPSASPSVPSSRIPDIDLILCDAHTTYPSSTSSPTPCIPFLDWSRSSPLTAPIPIILMSASVESSQVCRAINRGAFDHWQKPVQRALLLQTMRVIGDGVREERKAAVLREWGDRYKAAMMEERRVAALTPGLSPSMLARSALMFTPTQAQRQVSGVGQSVVGAEGGGVEGEPSLTPVLTLDGHTPAVLAAVVGREGRADEEGMVMDWLAGEGVDHERLSLDDAERRVGAMEEREKVGRGSASRGGKGSSSRASVQVGRIVEGEEREEDARVSSVLHLVQAGRKRGIDMLLVDVDGLDVGETARCHQLFDMATARGVSLILLSEAASSVALPSSAAIDAVLQKPLRKDVSHHLPSPSHSTFPSPTPPHAGMSASSRCPCCPFPLCASPSSW